MDKPKWNDDVLTAIEDNISIKTRRKLFIKQVVMGAILFGFGSAIIKYFEITDVISFNISAFLGGAFVLYCLNENNKIYHDKKTQEIYEKYKQEKDKWEQEQINPGKTQRSTNT